MSENLSSCASMEQLLQSWINMSMAIRGNRLVSGLSFNEMIICRILLDRQQRHGACATATELCLEMHLLKSQINKLLTSMETRELIQRRRSQTDKRKIEIRLTQRAEELYGREHERILRLISHVCDRLGPENAKDLTILLRDAVAAMHEAAAE